MALQANYQHLAVNLHKGLKTIKFNRPTKKNAINLEMYEEIIQALNESAKDDDVIITALSGIGEYYSSGNDISSFTAFAERDLDVVVKEASINLQRFVSAFIDFPKVLTAVVNGPAIGIAATTLALCDVVYASDKATFCTPFTSLGLSAEGCSTYTFPRIMGTSMASEMLYFNRQLSSLEAKSCGFVSSVFPHDTLAQEVWPKLEKMAELPAKSFLYSKRLIRGWDRNILHQACADECRQLEERWKSDDCINAVMRFMQRRSKL